MILAIDVGNTNIVVGAFDNDKLTFSARMSTDKNKLADEYAIDLKDIFALYGMDRPVTGRSSPALCRSLAIRCAPLSALRSRPRRWSSGRGLRRA